MPEAPSRAISTSRRAGALAGAAVLAAALVPAAAQAATPSTFRLTGTGPEYSRVDVARPDGGTTAAKPGLYRYRVTPDGQTAFDSQGYCVDLDHHIRRDVDYRVDLEDDSDDPVLASAGFRRAGWLLGRTDALLAAASDDQLEAGAIQIAVWQLTGQAASGPSPTGDAALDARAAELRALGASGEPRDALSVDIEGEESCVDEPAEVSVRGVPGTVVHLDADADATVSPANLTIDADGEVEAELTPVSAGAVRVTASANGERVVRATRRAGESEPQQQLLLRPVELAAQDEIDFVECPLLLDPPPEDPPPEDPPPEDPPVEAFGTAAPAADPPSAPAASAPAPDRSARADGRERTRARGARLRTSVRRVGPGDYRVVVRNVGTAPARAVKLSGVVRRGLRVRGAGRSRTWRIRTIAPRRAVVRSLRVRKARDGARMVRPRIVVATRATAAARPATRKGRT